MPDPLYAKDDPLSDREVIHTALVRHYHACAIGQGVLDDNGRVLFTGSLLQLQRLIREYGEWKDPNDG